MFPCIFQGSINVSYSSIFAGLSGAMVDAHMVFAGEI
jgi:hypothetical protein